MVRRNLSATVENYEDEGVTLDNLRELVSACDGWDGSLLVYADGGLVARLAVEGED